MPVLQSVQPGLQAAPAPRLATIRRLAQRCGVRDGALRTALSRACANGALEVTDGRYRLGPLSVQEAAAARARLDRTRGYRLAVVREGQAGDLRGLRELFDRFGLRALQRSVWIGARTPDDGLDTALRAADLDSAVVIFPTDEVDEPTRATLSQLWGLPERADALRAFHKDLTAYLTAPSLEPEEAAWRCVEAAPVWYRVAIRDEPPFPLDLLGADYPLDRLNAGWRDHLTAASQALAALWASNT